MNNIEKFQFGKSKEAPRDAFRISDVAEFATSPTLPERDASGVRRYPVKVTARRAGAVDHWYWGKIVHNNSGARTRDRVTFDWAHSDELVGYGDKVSVVNGSLTIEGHIVSTEDGDQADKLIRKGAAGIPYESSIFWDPFSAKMHYVKDGQSEIVNGQEFTGPGIVVDEWDLRGQAICPYGVDGQTKTQFTASGLPDVISLPPLRTENDMADVNPESSGTEVKDTSRIDLKRYMDKFGAAEGAQYFADGLSWEQALEKHCDSLATAKTAAEKAAKDAADKLASMDLGAEGPTTDAATGETGKTTKDGIKKDKDGKVRLQDAIRIK